MGRDLWKSRGANEKVRTWKRKVYDCFQLYLNLLRLEETFMKSPNAKRKQSTKQTNKFDDKINSIQLHIIVDPNALNYCVHWFSYAFRLL